MTFFGDIFKTTCHTKCCIRFAGRTKVSGLLSFFTWCTNSTRLYLTYAWVGEMLSEQSSSSKQTFFQTGRISPVNVRTKWGFE